MKTLLVLFIAAMLSACATPFIEPVTYHVRVNGGTAAQCTGRANTDYPGSGTDQACAWKGPMIALPPMGGKPRIAGGDTLMIHPGQYMIGYGAPGAEGCVTAYPYDCTMAAVPSGPSANSKTKIVGKGWNGDECKGKPELWGTERAYHVLSLKGSSNVIVACIEITDHSPCVVAHPSAQHACKRNSYPYGPYADKGIIAMDSSNVLLDRVNVHGLGVNGIHAGRLHNWTTKKLRLAMNGWSGWEGDLGESKGSSNTGTMRFDQWLVEWNGCGETAMGEPTGCSSHYGDGVGTYATAGDWEITNSEFNFNVSDGLDLLYHTLGGTVTLDRVRASSNAGNQLKVTGNVTVTNSYIYGDCGFFKGKPYTYSVDTCRAGGDAVTLKAGAVGDRVELINNTIVGNGNVILLGVGPPGSTLISRNNILVGMPYALDPSRTAGDTYLVEGIALDEAYALKQTLHTQKCNTRGTICGDAGLKNPEKSSHLLESSVAIDSGMADGAPDHDIMDASRPKGGGIDRGSMEEK